MFKNGKLGVSLKNGSKIKEGKKKLIPTGETFFECDDVLLAIGQENAFPWIERDIGIEFNQWINLRLKKFPFPITLPRFFLGVMPLGDPKTLSGLLHMATKQQYP
ncbi:MAG: hypothetical protein CM15mP73_0010 [Hyphomicrobiales bacterium]|nr:MAG: hypothetical protein CM15mP73_0010 [Hyphomicrobiales bacterium]